MKTKHILTALALPALFAACTADDIVSVDNGLQQVQRPLLSGDFTLTVNGEAESRYAVEGTTGLKFTFEEGDLIGANLIDAYDPSHPGFDAEDPATWPIVNYISPALPFENKNGAWVSAGELGIGNYLFTNPYNPEDKNRASTKYELPVVVHYDSKNPNAHIEAYNKAVAATVLREGDEMASISLKNLYTYPKIRINFRKTDEVSKVTKVILTKYYKTKTVTTGEGDDATSETVANEFIYKGAFNHGKVAEMFNPEELEAYLKANKKNTEESYWEQFQTSDFIIDTEKEKADAAGYIDIKTTPYFIYEMDEKVSSNSIEVRFMLPSIADLTAVEEEDKIMMVVCTDQGDFEVELTDINSYKWSNTTLAAKKASALWRNTSNTLNIDPEKLGESDDTYFVDNIVSTAADWNTLVEKYGDLKRYSAEYKEEKGWTPGNAENNDAAELVVTILDDEFALTSDLEMPEVAEFVIKTEVGVEGAVTLKNIKIDGSNLIVKKGATLTTDPTLVAGTVKVEKGGNLLFAAEYDEDEELVAYDGITTVDNFGTVTVPAGVIAQFGLNNASKDAVLNVGAETRAAATDAVANIYGVNNGIINNYQNGIINVVEKIGEEEMSLTNNAPSEAEEVGYEWDAEEKEWDGVPTINNFGKFNATGETVNYGLFNNNKELSSNFVGNASFVNGKAASQTHAYTGTLVVVKNAKTYIDSNADGVIELAELEPTDFTIHKSKKASQYSDNNYGTIRYELNDKDATEVSLKNSPVTELITNVGIELTNTWTYTDDEGDAAYIALDKLVVNGGTVAIAERTGAGTTESPYVYPARVTKLVINSGDVLVEGTLNAADAIYVESDATLGVPVDAVLSVKDLTTITTGAAVAGENAKDAGELIVNGELNLWDVNGNKDGIYGTVSGDSYTWTNPGSGNITLHKGVMITAKKNDTSAEDAAAALQTKYDNAVARWWSDILGNMGWIPTYYNYNPYDEAVFGKLLYGWYYQGDNTQKAYATELFKEFGFVNSSTGAEETTWTGLANQTKKEEAIAAKLKNNANFASALTSKVLTLADATGNPAYTDLKKFFIGTNAEDESILNNVTIAREEVTVYESKDEALTENIYKQMAGYGEKNAENVAKYVNIWKFKSDIAAAFDNTMFTNVLNASVSAEYAYIWKECDLDKVVKVMASVTYEDWKTIGLTTANNVGEFYTIEGVKEFLRLAWVKGGAAGAAGAAKTIADTYYEASKTWGYTTGQVSTLAGTLYDVNTAINQ